jgi:hypothetical protein
MSSAKSYGTDSISCCIPGQARWLNHELRICRNSERRGLPWAAGLFERFGDGEKKFFFERAGDELNADGQAF